MKGYILKYGLIGGIISSILGTLNWILIADAVGVDGSQAVGYISITVSLLCIPFGMKYFRDKLNEGKLGFGQAFKIGLGITSIAGIVMALHSVIFFALQKEEFIQWQKKGLSQAELAAYNEELMNMPEFAFAPWFQGMVMFLMVFLIGAVVNVISSLLLKQQVRTESAGDE